MEEFSSSVTDDFLACSLCSGQFTDPKLLPCYHSFCSGCLAGYIESTVKEAAKEAFSCPTCRRLVKARAGAGSPAEWANQLPENAFLVNIMERLDILGGGKFCDPCKRNQAERQGTAWCQQCRDALCSQCHQYHMALRVTMSHDVITLAEVGSGDMRAVIGVMHCERHAGKKLKSFCADCQEMICSACFMQKHRGCQRISPLDDAASHHRREGKALLMEMVNKKEVVEELGDSIDVQLSLLSDDRSRIVSEIRASTRQIEEVLHAKEALLLDSLERLYTKEESRLREHQDEADRVRRSMAAIYSLFLNAYNHGSAAEFLCLLKGVKHEVKRHKTDVDQMTSQVGKRKLVFQVNGDIRQPVNRFSELPLGVVSVLGESTADSIESVKKMNDPERAAATVETGIKPLETVALSFKTATSVGSSRSRNVTSPLGLRNSPLLRYDFRIKTANDEMNCRPTAVTLLPDRFILITDNTNSRLKKLTLEGDVVDQILLSSRPRDLSAISESRVVVTLPLKRQLAFLSHRPTLEIGERVSTEKPYEAVEVIPGTEQLVCSCCWLDGPACVDVVSFRATVLRSLVHDNFRRRLFFDPWYVTTTSGGDVLVTDDETKSLTCCRVNGTKRFAYKGEADNSLFSPSGVCRDQNGSIYVADIAANRVYRLTPDGELDAVLVTEEDGLLKPMALFVSNTGELIVTEFDGKLKIFKV